MSPVEIQAIQVLTTLLCQEKIDEDIKTEAKATLKTLLEVCKITVGEQRKHMSGIIQ